MSDLIDTTEMYLKTIFELEEDGIEPLRARIVERLGHSGPTVSQTIARMERDDLVVVSEDRQLELTKRGREVANEVMRKHRLAECLLVEVIGLDWAEVHDEACRWEHVMSGAVENRLPALLGDPTHDPYGNPVPGVANVDEDEISALAAAEAGVNGAITRIGEVIQADPAMISAFQTAGLLPGVDVRIESGTENGGTICVAVANNAAAEKVALPDYFAAHLFVK